MDKVNVIQHMNEIRNILSYATNIGFFFGAGTSCAFGLPNIMTLTSECRERLNEMRQNKRLYVMVLCYTDEQVDMMSGYATTYMNLCVMGPKKVITNGMEKSWMYDDSVDADVGYGLYWDKTKEEFLLGDFKKLIEFLIENSGRKSMIEEIVNAK